MKMRCLFPFRPLLFLLFFPIHGGVHAQSATERSPQADLTSEEPGKAELDAFGTRVEQKLHDLADYIGIASDASYSQKLRERAAEQASALFEKAGNELSGIPIDEGRELRGAVSAVFDTLKSQKQPLVSVRIEELRRSPLQKREEGLYEGSFELRVRCELRRAPKQDAYFQKELKLKGKSVLKKVTKALGEEKERVWEVFLGPIGPLED